VQKAYLDRPLIKLEKKLKRHFRYFWGELKRKNPPPLLPLPAAIAARRYNNHVCRRRHRDA
jgi:hypothetical protein